MRRKPTAVYFNTLNALGTTKEYYHGIESCAIHKGDQLKDAYVEIQGLIGSPTKVSVAYQFMTQLGDTVPPKYQIDVLKMLKSCNGILRTYCETNNCKETYIQVCNLRLYKEGHRFFSKYELPNCDNQIKADLLATGYNIVSEVDAEGLTTYYWIEEVNMLGAKPNKLDYYMFADKLRKKGIWYFTDGDRYRTFISTDPIHISTESIIYCLMFFFGSITRYHPCMFDNLLSEQQRWLISEFLKTQPKQFLHAVTSRTIESAILKPNTANLNY